MAVDKRVFEVDACDDVIGRIDCRVERLRAQSLTSHAVAADNNLQRFVKPSVDARAALNVTVDYAAAVQAVGGNRFCSVWRCVVEANNKERAVNYVDALCRASATAAANSVAASHTCALAGARLHSFSLHLAHPSRAPAVRIPKK
jgi:hypothetical protein